MKNKKSKTKNYELKGEVPHRALLPGLAKRSGAGWCGGQAVIISVILFLFISLFIVFGMVGPATINLKIAQDVFNSKKSYFLAEAGGEDAIYRVKNGKLISSIETIDLDGHEVTTNITSVGDEKEIISIADVAGDIRKTRVYVTASIGVDFFYGVQVGEGGLLMDQNSRIEGVGGAAGNVYSNGPAIGAAGATVTGDLTVATAVSEDVQARSTVCNEDQIVGQADPEIDFAQSFSPSDSQPLAKVSFYIKKIGSPGDADILVANDQAGSPAQSFIAEAKLFSSLVGDDYAWIDVTFPSPPNLISGNTYWLVLDAKKDQHKYWSWCKDKNQGYGNGVGKYSDDWDDNPWTQIVGDLTFKTYLGSGVNSIDNLIVLGTAKANTVINSQICGDVYYQIIDASSLIFVDNPSNPTCPDPLTPGTAFSDQPDSPIANMPISQAIIQDWKDGAEAGGIIDGNCGDDGVPECDIPDDGTLILESKKINGNLVLTKKQTLIVKGGPLYFTGYIDMDSAGGATIKCDASFGSKSCLIITDSWMHIRNNSIFEGSGESGSYIMFLSTLTTCVGGVQQPECTHDNSAVDIHNNASGAIFYAPDSLIIIHNGVNVTEVTAYKLRLDNTAVVTYEEGLINSQFSAGPSGGWDINEWREIE